jgi:hypothetical protein
LLKSPQRGRVYILSSEPEGSFLADHKGRKYIPSYGCPVYSLGEPYYAEAMLPKGYTTIIDWFQEVGLDPDYANPVLERFDEESDDEDQKPSEGGVELNRIEELKGDEETEVGDGESRAGKETKNKENTKPVEEKP